ncbi:MAG: CidA/LrgA family protein [Marinifilaceae bacterium]
MLKQVVVVMMCLLLGNAVKYLLGVSVPGSVFGMLILFLLLKQRLVKESDVSKFANFLLDNMAFFFVPPGVGILLYLDMIKKEITPIVGASIISTLLVFLVVGIISGGRNHEQHS